jgi:ribosome maturation factor RimP
MVCFRRGLRPIFCWFAVFSGKFDGCEAPGGEPAEMAFVAIVLQLDPVARKVAETLEPHIERQGYELVGVEFRKGTRSSLLRLLVDKPEGGIALSDLEILSPILGDLLDVYDPVEGRYTLEVSSPGINRPLTKVAHFQAHCGKRVKLRTYQPRAGRKIFIGTLAAADESGIALEEENLHTLEEFAFNEIQSANYEYEFD